ncbi:hypothetical protein KKE26_00450 [bacterium]|nr:hypothetical protein [bacterium]
MIQGILLIMVIITTAGCAGMRSMAASDSRYGTNCIMLNLWHDAKFHLEKAVKNNPNNIFACNNLGVVYEYFGDNEAAKCFYEKAISIFVENAKTQDRKGTETQGKEEKWKEKDTETQRKNGKSSSSTRTFADSCYQNLKGLMEETGQTEVSSLSQIMPQGTVSVSKKILSKRVEIQKKLPSILNMDGINKVELLVLLADKKTEEITKKIVEAFKEKVQEESSFYINEEILQEINEVSSIAKDKPLSIIHYPLSLSLQNHEAIIDLCNDYDVQGLFVIEIIEFNDDRTNMATTKSRYSEEERRYIYYDVPSINRKITLKMRFCFLEAKTGNLLWDKKYDISKIKEYPVKDEEKIPLYDMELFENLCNEPSSSFMAATKPQYKYSKRQVLMER